MADHPTAAELQGLVYGGLSAERKRAVVAHLLRGCAACGGELAPYLAPAPAPPRTAEQRKREAVALLASRGLEGLADAPPDLEGLPVFEALLERSWVLRYEDPGQMVELARCAALLADKLSEAEHGAQETADLRCRAWVELANAYRIADELDRADEALDRATHYYVVGDREKNKLLGARFFDVLASQYAARRAFRMACSTLGVVADIYQQHGDGHLAGRALIMRGIFTGYQGDAEEAVRWIQQGLSAVDERRDPGLASSALQNQAWFLVDCGRFREAQRALWELRRRNPDAGGRLNELKVRWLEGHIFVGLEKLDRAERALEQVKEGFEEAGLPFKAALAGLELGAVRLRQGRFEEANEIVLECSGVFLALGIGREALAAVLLLREAGERRKISLTILDHAIACLRKVEREPGVHLQPAAAG